MSRAVVINGSGLTPVRGVDSYKWDWYVYRVVNSYKWGGGFFNTDA